MKKFLLLFIAGISTAFAVPTITLTSTVNSGVSPLSVVLTWSSTEATVCNASGSWSGSKALSGTETITGLTSNSNFTLSCYVANGTAKLTWVAPTQNTDGSTLTNLAGFKVFKAGASADVAAATPVIISSPTTLTYTYSGLNAGTHYFGVKAFSTIDSSMSAIVSKVITLTPVVASVSITVETKPKVVTGLTVQ